MMKKGYLLIPLMIILLTLTSDADQRQGRFCEV